MNIYLPIISSFLFFSCSVAEKDAPGEAGKLIKLEREAIEREFKNDTAFLSSIMDSTFIELDNDKIKNKHQVLQTIYRQNLDNINNKITLDSFILEDTIVHLYDNTAVVSFIIHTYRKNKGVPFEKRTRFYDVWVKRNNQWKAVTWQATPIK